MLSVNVLAAQLSSWVALSHSDTVSISPAVAPEQTKYSRDDVAVVLSLPADQFKVNAVGLTPDDAENEPAVGTTESELVV